MFALCITPIITVRLDLPWMVLLEISGLEAVSCLLFLRSHGPK